MSLLAEACEWAHGLRLAAIPEDVSTLATAELVSDMGAAWAGIAHPAGARVAGRWRDEGARGAAVRAAALTLLLDWDETCFAGHIGHSTALPTLLLGAEAGWDGGRVLSAIVASGELAARVTAAVTLGRARGQAAGHTHLAGGAVVAGLVAGLDAKRLTAAVGLALAQPREVLLPAFMGSDAKFAVAAAPLLDALSAVDAAAKGATAEDGIMERHNGLLQRLAVVPLPEAMTDYGERWHLRTLSFKRDPGCAYISAAVEAAAELGPLALDEVDAVEVGCSIFTIGMEAESAPYINGSMTPLPALNFSLGYSVAAALEQGALTGADFGPERLSSEERWRVARAVSARHDLGLTLSALGATAPVGMALAWAGDRARPYLEAGGATSEMADMVLEAARGNLDDPLFERPCKRVGADVALRLRDGRRLESRCDSAAGSCQEPAGARRNLAAAKFRRTSAAGGEAQLALALRLPDLSVDEVRELSAPLRAALDTQAGAITRSAPGTTST